MFLSIYSFTLRPTRYKFEALAQIRLSEYAIVYKDAEKVIAAGPVNEGCGNGAVNTSAQRHNHPLLPIFLFKAATVSLIKCAGVQSRHNRR